MVLYVADFGVSCDSFGEVGGVAWFEDYAFVELGCALAFVVSFSERVAGFDCLSALAFGFGLSGSLVSGVGISVSSSPFLVLLEWDGSD